MRKPNKRRPDRTRYVWTYYYAWERGRVPIRRRFLASIRTT